MLIVKTIEWDMGHRLPNHKSKCKNLHGHRYKLEVFIKGVPKTKKGQSDQGMIIDFSDLKKILKETVLVPCDHAFMIYEKDALMENFFKKNPKLKSIIVPFIPTVENISKWIFSKLEKELKNKVGNKISLDKVKLWETPTSSAIYKG